MHETNWPPRLVWEIMLPLQMKGEQLLEALIDSVLGLPEVRVLTLACFENTKEAWLVEITSSATLAPDSMASTRYYVAGIDNKPLLIRHGERYSSVRLVMQDLRRDDPELIGPWREVKDLAERIERRLLS